MDVSIGHHTVNIEDESGDVFWEFLGHSFISSSKSPPTKPDKSVDNQVVVLGKEVVG